MNSRIEQPVMDPKQVNRNRIKLLGVFGVALIPVVAAAVMYFGGVALPTGKTNKGNLVWPPVVLSDQQVISSELIAEIQKDGLWVLMLTGSGACEAVCEERLHTIRQVNVSMGKALDRVGRLYLGDVAFDGMPNVVAKYPKLKLFETESSRLAAFESLAVDSSALERASLEANWNIWLVDPLGNVILQYGLENDGYDMIGDLKKLLKLSNIG